MKWLTPHCTAQLEKALDDLRAEMQAAFDAAKSKSDAEISQLKNNLGLEKSDHAESVRQLTEAINELKKSHGDSASSLQKAHEEMISGLRKSLKTEHELRLTEEKEAAAKQMKSVEEKNKTEREVSE